MDWETTFYSIVKETDENLTKAKDKLIIRPGPLNTLDQRKTFTRPTLSVPPILSSQNFDSMLNSSYLKERSADQTYLTPFENSNVKMTSISGYQVQHMQEQINTQNRTIEKLQKLVRSLDNERDFYKQQISHLKGEVETLTDKMSSALKFANNEWQMSSIKREVMHEIEKVKTMLHNVTKQGRKQILPVTPAFDADFWAVKENFSQGLDQVRQELTLMNKRIDRMESQTVSENVEKLDTLSKNYQSRSKKTLPLYSPLPVPLHYNSSDVQQLRMAVSSVSAKLDSLEKKLDASVVAGSSYRSGRPYTSYKSTTSTPGRRTSRNSLLDDLSLSDVSSCSDLELDGEFDVHKNRPRRISFSRPNSATKTRSLYKKNYRRKDEDLDFSDLDLSDVDDLEYDNLDLDI
ncbi:uncharacterized protein LOC131930547 [Physella acuta]|uniref:uncharacterized protein LOC131930547 n=1 Tax=Physella acuta TaxID=109671 RepID=UPI0027DC8F9F|nr:uncharacterized protein LOC131930547 [Physella acuta]XP_059143067.1 uncharacterized protein LOC131930547 [Physella acuta]XP_059143068.1 uncharacterized protein LOC131930547 [Physella acuta]